MRTAYEKIRFFGKRLLPLPLLVLAVSCGAGQGTVSGKVYYQGKMLTSGAVRFVYEGQGGSYTSDISSDGTYKILKAPRGLAKIGVATAVSGMEIPKGGPAGRGGPSKQGIEKMKEKMKENQKGRAPEGKGPAEDVIVPKKYSDPETSGLQVEVTGSKQNFDIKIE
jgi:hypothetical protein